MPPGGGYYPQGLTREQIEQYVKDHPEKKSEIYSQTTIVRWQGNQLQALPYHIAYRSFFEPAAKDLREAAAFSDDPGFRQLSTAARGCACLAMIISKAIWPGSS